MDASEIDIRLARLVESEHGKVLIEVIDVWIEGIVANLDLAKTDEIPKVVGAWQNMRQFRNHIVKTPDVINAMNKIRDIETSTI
jgi:hypothetical protein